MNKRDKFAMAAMQAIISKPTSFGHMPFGYEAQQVAEEIAQASYIYADALLVEGSLEDQCSCVCEDCQQDFINTFGATAFFTEEHPCKGGCEACVGCNASDSQEHFEAVKQPEKFVPVSIQLKQQGMVDLVASLVGGVTGNDAKNLFGVDNREEYDLFDKLDDLAEYRLDTDVKFN